MHRQSNIQHADGSIQTFCGIRHVQQLIQRQLSASWICLKSKCVLDIKSTRWQVQRHLRTITIATPRSTKRLDQRSRSAPSAMHIQRKAPPWLNSSQPVISSASNAQTMQPADDAAQREISSRATQPVSAAYLNGADHASRGQPDQPGGQTFITGTSPISRRHAMAFTGCHNHRFSLREQRQTAKYPAAGR